MLRNLVSIHSITASMKYIERLNANLSAFDEQGKDPSGWFLAFSYFGGGGGVIVGGGFLG